MRLAVAKAHQPGYVYSGVHAGHDGHVTDRLDLKICVWEVHGEFPIGCYEFVGDGSVFSHG